MQLAMFVAPVLVLASFAFGHPLLYLLEHSEIIAVLSDIVPAGTQLPDGKTY